MNAASAHADTERRESVIELLLWKERVAPLEHRAQVWPDGIRNHLVAGSVRVKRVIEVQCVVFEYAQEKERHERHVVALGKPREDAMKLECVAQSAERRCFHLAK